MSASPCPPPPPPLQPGPKWSFLSESSCSPCWPCVLHREPPLIKNIVTTLLFYLFIYFSLPAPGLGRPSLLCVILFKNLPSCFPRQLPDSWLRRGTVSHPVGSFTTFAPPSVSDFVSCRIGFFQESWERPQTVLKSHTTSAPVLCQCFFSHSHPFAVQEAVPSHAPKVLK